VFDSNRRVAEALDVPAVALELWVYLGFVPLAVGGMAQIGWLGYIAMVVGLGLVLIGIRAALRASRPFDPGVPAMSRLVPTTRAVGVFYAVAGTCSRLCRCVLDRKGPGARRAEVAVPARLLLVGARLAAIPKTGPPDEERDAAAEPSFSPRRRRPTDLAHALETVGI
jgi:hypothetical protein